MFEAPELLELPVVPGELGEVPLTLVPVVPSPVALEAPVLTEPPVAVPAPPAEAPPAPPLAPPPPPCASATAELSPITKASVNVLSFMIYPSEVVGTE